VTVMVTDRGVGFDPAAVAPDRLGLRTSVVERMAAVGGNAQVWSAPGEGTSVIISAPTAQREAS
jgi:signal transduction histidine kinase